MDDLLLTKADNANYRAVCAILADRKVRTTGSRRPADKLSQARKLALLQRQDYECAECGKPFVVHKGRCLEATEEHVIPYRYGGMANAHNIILVCEPCNIKRDMEFSIEMVEDHFGPIDRDMIEYVPVMYFQDEQKTLRNRAARYAAHKDTVGE